MYRSSCGYTLPHKESTADGHLLRQYSGTSAQTRLTCTILSSSSNVEAVG